MLRLLFTPLLILGVAFGLFGIAQNVLKGHSYLDHRWNEGGFPLEVDLESFGQIGGISKTEARTVARAAMADWNHALGRTAFAEGTGDSALETSAIGDGSAPAYTDIQSTGGAAVAFKITVNTSHRFSTSPDGESGAYDLETVLVHELGHALGLAHPIPSLLAPLGDYGELICLIPPASSRVMCPRLKGQVMRSPGEDDIAGVQALYGW